MHRSGIISLLSLLVVSAAAGLYPDVTPYNHTCALVDPVLSCSDSATPEQVDSCCTETFGGLVLLTQFWTVYTGLETEGQLLPKDSWGIHGLWPDFCNGSYTSYCDLSRQYDPKPSPNKTDDGTPVPVYSGASIDSFFEPYGKLDLLAYMHKYWGPQAAKYTSLFTYFETTIKYFRTLPTWSWLTAASIQPSNTTSYTLSDIQDALDTGFGVAPFVGCSGPRYNETEAGAGSDDSGRTQLSEVWYYYHVYGAPQRAQGLRVPADIAGGRLSSCAQAEGAVWYYERAEGSEA